MNGQARESGGKTKEVVARTMSTDAGLEKKSKGQPRLELVQQGKVSLHLGCFPRRPHHQRSLRHQSNLLRQSKLRLGLCLWESTQGRTELGRCSKVASHPQSYYLPIHLSAGNCVTDKWSCLLLVGSVTYGYGKLYVTGRLRD